MDSPGYDAWRAGGDNPGGQCAEGACGYCEGNGMVEVDHLEGPGWREALCPHCGGEGECGCSDCEQELKEKLRSE